MKNKERADIRIRRNTKERLGELKPEGESWDSFLKRLAKLYIMCQQLLEKIDKGEAPIQIILSGKDAKLFLQLRDLVRGKKQHE